MTESKESLIAYCRQKDRICPMPQRWNELYELLLRGQVSLSAKPPAPLILMAWYEPDISKQDRLTEHIEWAAQHGALAVASDFLQGLREADWFHTGD